MALTNPELQYFTRSILLMCPYKKQSKQYDNGSHSVEQSWLNQLSQFIKESFDIKL